MVAGSPPIRKNWFLMGHRLGAGMKKTLFLNMLAAAAIAGCVGAPPSVTEAGARPTTDPEPQIRQLMHGLLKDPESATYQRVGGPVPGQTQRPMLQGGAIQTGWGFCYLINAKNSYGGYTGAEPYYFVFRGNRLVGWARNAQLSSWNCF